MVRLKREWDPVTIEKWDDIRKAVDLANSGRFDEAVSIFRRLSELGSVYAQVQLAYLYEEGNGVEPDRTKSAELYKSAANSGVPFAVFYYARYLQKIERNGDSFGLMKLLAAEGYLPAIYKLSIMYRDGIGHDKDLEQYRYYLKYAANHGHIWAQRRLAVEMLKGKHGVRQIPGGAAKFLNMLWGAFSIARHDPNDDRLRA